MLAKFLLIGIGGSGGKTLRFLYNSLASELDQFGFREKLPSGARLPVGWQFVHIDSPTAPEVDEQHLPLDLPTDAYVGLVGPSVRYRAVASLLDRPDRRDACAGWLPDFQEVTVTIEDGAGQYRALGRAIGLARMQEIALRLKLAIIRLNSDEASRDLAALDKHLASGSLSHEPPHPVAIVVSSIAGGTGAGMIQDVCDQLRLLDEGGEWVNGSVAILYAPDVFDTLPETHRRGVQGNALGAMAELLAGHWNNELLTDAETSLFSSSAVAGRNRRGPRYTFLVGGTNGQVRFPDQQDVFRAMGKTLSVWMLREEVQSDVRNHLSANWENTAASADFLESGERVEAPLNALGCATLDLGRGRFRTYAGQCIARHALEQLLTDERVHGRVPAERQVEALHPAFHKAVGLHDAGTRDSEVLQALDPAYREVIASKQDAAWRNLNAHGHITAHDWIAVIDGEVNAAAKGFLEERRRAAGAYAVDWVEKVQARVLVAVREHLARDGFVATMRLLTLTIEKLRIDVSDRLPPLADRYGRSAMDSRSRISSHLQPAGGESRRRRLFRSSDSRLGPEHKLVEQALKDSMYYRLAGTHRATLCRLAGALLQELIDDFLLPLREELARAFQTLSNAETRTVGLAARDANHPSRWPDTERHAVPGHLFPGPNELLVADLDEFPRLFEVKVAESQGEQQFQNAIPKATTLVILGPGGSDGDDLVRCTTRWAPRELTRWQSQQRRRRATFEVATLPADLLARALDWVERRDHALGRHVRQSLREYLNGDFEDVGQDLNTRLRRFEEQFTQVLEIADPLVTLDEAMMVSIGQQAAPKRIMSPLPFAREDPAYQVTLDLLVGRAKLEEQQAVKLLRAGKETKVEISTFLTAPFPPHAFHSLMGPIMRDWKDKRNRSAERAKFWQWRRTRPLPAFVPVPPAVRLAMVRGWFTGLVLGQLREHQPDFEIAQSEPGGPDQWYRLPVYGQPAYLDDPDESLAATLESLPLALAEHAVEGELAVLEGYRQLVRLGRPSAGRLRDYERPNPALIDFVRRGMLPAASAASGSELVESNSTPASRCAYLAGKFARFGEFGHERYLAAPRTIWAGAVSRAWELRDDLKLALEQLHGAVILVADWAER